MLGRPGQISQICRNMKVTTQSSCIHELVTACDNGGGLQSQGHYYIGNHGGLPKLPQTSGLKWFEMVWSCLKWCEDMQDKYKITSGSRPGPSQGPARAPRGPWLGPGRLPLVILYSSCIFSHHFKPLQTISNQMFGVIQASTISYIKCFWCLLGIFQTFESYIFN